MCVCVPCPWCRRAVEDPHSDPDLLPQDLLRKYLTYAKQHCRPQLQQADYDKIQRVGARAWTH